MSEGHGSTPVRDRPSIQSAIAEQFLVHARDPRASGVHPTSRDEGAGHAGGIFLALSRALGLMFSSLDQPFFLMAWRLEPLGQR
jgi:hypothetical protein